MKIKDFIEKYARIKNGEYIYFIDGEVLNTDENLMYVDEKNIMQVKVTKLDKTEKSKKLYFVKLLTRTKENLKKGDTIYIRGNELSVNN
ncbi:hypothetical protein CG09_0347 [Riemerella anatipestifer]|nr:hypothetical protein [Riemerella anatipestifer]AKP70623.1 hypothetical protein CG09_0347 [Riemerella anatipestifer]